jgi:hypothetical protein
MLVKITASDIMDSSAVLCGWGSHKLVIAMTSLKNSLKDHISFIQERDKRVGLGREESMEGIKMAQKSQPLTE